jgi:hypothetical protein
MSANPHKARALATLSGIVRHPQGSVNYFVTAMFECSIMEGVTLRSAKIPVDVIGARNEQDYIGQVKDSLVAALNARWPGENFVARDVMLFGL